MRGVVKKGLCVSLVLCLAILLYTGCKKKTQPIAVPISIVRVTYSDSDEDGYVSNGDQLIVQFDRHIILNSGNVDAVFDLSIGGDSFGTGASMLQTSGHALTITMGTGTPDFLATDMDGYIVSGIRVSEAAGTMIPPAIEDASWHTGMAGGGAYTLIEGRVGYAAPVLLSAIYEDAALPAGLSKDDTITLTFTGPVDVNALSYFGANSRFVVPVVGDTFGWWPTAIQAVAGSDTVVINLGDNPDINTNGTHNVGTYTVDSASGIDIAIGMLTGYITFDVGGADITVPPTAVDIDAP